ncbi:helix-turn-helix transcriptional regulator [Cryptosporangium minutisporangium]|uniref:HTH cro/C1-type domain-containing protein n=1 Tax=Cryptosporangium minutisporangium TaxID=113569 RepID=A0ABP6SXS4_9ACTN
MDRSDRVSAVTDAQRLASALRQHRTRAGLTQQQLARRVGYSRSTIANAETGDVRSAEFYRRCDAVLRTGGTLETTRRSLAAATSRRRVSATDSRSAGKAAAPVGQLDPIPRTEAIEHLRQHWHLLVRTDNLLGPQTALPIALEHLSTLTVLLRDAVGAPRLALLGLAVRYAETAAWLHQDTGHLDDAAVWADRALDWAHESGDNSALAWVLHRRSQLRAAEGDAAGALSLVRAARRSGADVDPPLAAALRVQQAWAYSMRGDRRRCEGLLDRAAPIADARETAGDGRAGYGGHCTRAWVLAHRGACALRFDTPGEAALLLRAALTGLAPVYRRNRGLVLGWLAEASARAGATDQALRAAAQSRAIGEATGSATVLAQVHAVEQLTASRAGRTALAG